MDNLPEDVLYEILLLLPIKSLVCMRSLCKSWRSRILNPNFVQLHMSTTMANPNNQYLVAYEKTIYPHQLSVININFLGRGKTLLDFPLHLPKPCFIVGSCNGLLCVAYESFSRQTLKSLYLWNPATREVKLVPEHTNIKFDENNVYRDNVSIGFCFDPSSGDYKVVRIVIGCGSPWYPVEVYSLIKNYWKKFDLKLKVRFFESNPTIVESSVYWFVMQFCADQPWALVSFNVKSENLSLISVPDSIMWREEQTSSSVGLFQFEESVAITLTDRKCQNEEIISVWTLNDDSCWIKKFTIRNPSVISKIVGYLKTGKFVGTDFIDVYLYDSANNVMKARLFRLFCLYTRGI